MPSNGIKYINFYTYKKHINSDSMQLMQLIVLFKNTQLIHKKEKENAKSSENADIKNSTFMENMSRNV